MNNFIEELRWRGMLQDMTPEIVDYLNKGMASAYLGFDPTADSLHIGHLVGVMTLLHFQRAGHKPYALVGGATRMIGDPSFKSSKRNLLDKATLDHNVACLQTLLWVKNWRLTRCNLQLHPFIHTNLQLENTI